MVNTTAAVAKHIKHPSNAYLCHFATALCCGHEGLPVLEPTALDRHKPLPKQLYQPPNPWMEHERVSSKQARHHPNTHGQSHPNTYMTVLLHKRHIISPTAEDSTLERSVPVLFSQSMLQPAVRKPWSA